VRRLLLITLACALIVVAPARAATADWSVAELENEVMCTVCHQLLSQSQSAFAIGVRAQIQQKHDLGWSKQRTLDWLVQQYGEEVLAAPPKHGFDLLAWLVPAAVLLGGAGVTADAGMDARIDADLERDE